MEFSLPSDVIALRERTREFIASQVIPLENDERQDSHGPSEALRQELMARARVAGLLTPHASIEMGGMGLSHVAKAAVFEEAGYSWLGPTALNVHAPDEGNIHLMERVASAAQKERWLRAQVRDGTRSCFAMTEPAPGSGADPSMLATTAVRDGDDYLINGLKWFITGAEGAQYAIVMARTEDGAATMFLTDMDRPGIVLERNMDTMDRCFAGGHAVLRFYNLRIPATDILGEAGKGFRYAQVRLAPARLTHCMRWLGAARRAHEIALDRAVRREMFGAALADLGMAQQLIADNEIDLAAARALLWQTCWQLATGSRGTEESSRTKVFVSEAAGRIVDRSVQLAGGLGTSEDLVIGRIYADIRAFRIYDGASETHRMSIARRVARRARLAAGLDPA